MKSVKLKSNFKEFVFDFCGLVIIILLNLVLLSLHLSHACVVLHVSWKHFFAY